LFGAGSAAAPYRDLGPAGQPSKDRRLLQKNEEMMSKQNETLERARKTMMETETVALEITDELSSNRDKLLSAQGRIREMTGLTGRAKRLLNSMNQRNVQQKLYLYGTAVGLFLAFVIILYTMWR
jgi:hypothetical protein